MRRAASVKLSWKARAVIVFNTALGACLGSFAGSGGSSSWWIGVLGASCGALIVFLYERLPSPFNNSF
ncbi:MAG: hypothetical protein U9N45_04300 [Gemmatimonadota bacterium]|nr:hypothetical protein [Gemmatimonadota bacterium]